MARGKSTTKRSGKVAGTIGGKRTTRERLTPRERAERKPRAPAKPGQRKTTEPAIPLEAWSDRGPKAQYELDNIEGNAIHKGLQYYEKDLAKQRDSATALGLPAAVAEINARLIVLRGDDRGRAGLLRRFSDQLDAFAQRAIDARDDRQLVIADEMKDNGPATRGPLADTIDEVVSGVTREGEQATQPE